MNPQEFEQILSQYRTIKEEHVTPKLDFYKKRVDLKRFAAQGAGVVILILSLLIPIVVNLDFVSPWPSLSIKLIVSAMSLSIAFFSGLAELYRWQHTWKEYSKRIVQIDTMIGSWEVEVANARQLSDPTEISGVLGKATDNLLRTVEMAVLTEMEAFFATVPKARAEKSGQA